MTCHRLLLPLLAGTMLSGCVAYSDPGVVAGPPPPVPYQIAGPPPPYYAAPQPRQRVWVPGRCDRYGRCYRGRWVWR